MTLPRSMAAWAMRIGLGWALATLVTGLAWWALFADSQRRPRYALMRHGVPPADRGIAFGSMNIERERDGMVRGPTASGSVERSAGVRTGRRGCAPFSQGP